MQPLSEDEDSNEYTNEDVTIKPSSISNLPLSSKSEKSVTFGAVEIKKQFTGRKIQELKPLESRMWLYENLMTRYWLGESLHVEASASRSSNLVYDW